MMARLIGYLRNHSQELKWLFFIFLASCIVFDFFADRHEPHFWGDTIIGFWTLVGIVGCLGMIIICKGLSHIWLMKGEDYYDD